MRVLARQFSPSGSPTGEGESPRNPISVNKHVVLHGNPCEGPTRAIPKSGSSCTFADSRQVRLFPRLSMHCDSVHLAAHWWVGIYGQRRLLTWKPPRGRIESLDRPLCGCDRTLTVRQWAAATAAQRTYTGPLERGGGLAKPAPLTFKMYQLN